MTSSAVNNDMREPLDAPPASRGAASPNFSKVFVRGVGPADYVGNTSDDQIQVEINGSQQARYDPQDVVVPTGRRLDHLRPAADDPSRRVNSASAVFSLLSTMVGGGVLSLPFAYQQSGIILAIATTCLSALASGMTIDMLIGASRATGAVSYDTVAQRAFGKSGRLLTLSLTVGLIWLCQIAYLVLLADLMVPVLAAMPGPIHMATKGVRAIVICGAVALISPLCFQTSLHALRFMSVVAFTALIIVVFSLSKYAFTTFGTPHRVHIFVEGHEKPVHVGADTMNLWPAGWNEFLYVFPIFGLSFLCHFNVLPMHGELRDPTRGRTKKVIFNAIFACNVLYCVAGWCGQVYAGKWTCGNILLNFGADEMLINVSRVALSLTLMGTFPLFVLPCRASVHQLLQCLRKSNQTPEQEQQASDCSAQIPVDADLIQVAPSVQADAELAQAEAAMSSKTIHVYDRRRARDRVGSELVVVGHYVPVDEEGQALTWSTGSFVMETLVLVLSSVFFACVLEDVLVVWTIAGSTVSFAIAFALPTSMWIKVHSQHCARWKTLVAKGLLVLSILLSVACTYEVVKNIKRSGCPTP